MSRLDLRAVFRKYISQQSLNLENREHFVFFQGQMDSSEIKMLSSMKNTCSAHEYHEEQKKASCFGLVVIFKAGDLDLPLSIEKQMHKEAMCTKHII